MGEHHVVECFSKLASKTRASFTAAHTSAEGTCFLNAVDVRAFLAEDEHFSFDEVATFMNSADPLNHGAVEFDSYKHGFKVVQKEACIRLNNHIVLRTKGDVDGKNFLVRQNFNSRVAVLDKVGMLTIEDNVNCEIV